ncbi:hypothetical protein, partial [Kribbella solani]|uniref:hypothetical protein n=1 Tax=Kribbella solani TaxID=236067 RepID=UPI0029BBC9DB
PAPPPTAISEVNVPACPFTPGMRVVNGQAGRFTSQTAAVVGPDRSAVTSDASWLSGSYAVTV